MANGAELELRVGAKEWSGLFLLSGLWRKGAIGGWKLAEFGLARRYQADELPVDGAKLQLWN